MANREPPYDPYIPAAGSGPAGSGQYEGGNPRTAAIQSVGAIIPMEPRAWQKIAFKKMGS